MRGKGVGDSAFVGLCSEEEVIVSEKSLPYVTGSMGAIVACVAGIVDKRPIRLPAGRGSALLGGYVSPGDCVGALIGSSCGAMLDVLRWWLVGV